MSVALFSTVTRLALAAAATALVLLAVWLFRRRRPVRGAAAGVLALGALGALAAEGMIGIAVHFGAPNGVDFNEHRWVMLAPWGRFTLLLGGATTVAIIGLSWRATRAAGGWQRATIVGLRSGAAVAAFVMFVEPAIELRQVAREPNRIAILVDDSLSMALRETPDQAPRIARMQQLLNNSSEALDVWQRDHKLDFYTFSDALRATSIVGLATNAATGRATDLRKALETVRGRYDGHDLAGIVVLSDGAATGQFDDEATAGAARDFLRSLDTRVHTVLAAGPGLRDVAVAKVIADEFAFVRTVVKIEAVVRITPGMAADGTLRQMPVTLSTDGEPLREKIIDVPATGGDVRVSFEVTPPRVGRYVYQLSVPAFAGEAVTSNNVATFLIRVIRDKVRVLQVSGQPSWDEKALRQMLKSNPNVDLISFFILRTQDDISMVPNDEMSLIPFPTRELFEEQLPSFDVIVLQNFEYMPYGIGEYLENLRSYVDGGGGLVMLGGAASFSSGGYFGTPLADALPLQLTDVFADNNPLVDTQRFSPVLTDAGNVHPLTALRFAANDNQAAWKSLPPLEGVNLVPAGAKPDATVLAVHPRLKASNGKAMPVIAVTDYGKGRSLAVTTDTLWRWGFVAAQKAGDDGRHYTKFWENSIRWLIQDPDLRNLHVDTDAVEYERGAPVQVNVRLLGRDYQPLPAGTVKLTLQRGAAPATAVPVKDSVVTVGADGTATQQYADLEAGIYRVRGTATVDGREVEATDIFLVKETGKELDQPQGDPETLQMLAQITNGTALGAITALPSDLRFDTPRVVRVDRRADVELWNRPGVLLLMVLLLGLEWFLRQRSGYV